MFEKEGAGKQLLRCLFRPLAGKGECHHDDDDDNYAISDNYDVK